MRKGHLNGNGYEALMNICLHKNHYKQADPVAKDDERMCQELIGHTSPEKKLLCTNPVHIFLELSCHRIVLGLQEVKCSEGGLMVGQYSTVLLLD